MVARSQPTPAWGAPWAHAAPRTRVQGPPRTRRASLRTALRFLGQDKGTVIFPEPDLGGGRRLLTLRPRLLVAVLTLVGGSALVLALPSAAAADAAPGDAAPGDAASDAPAALGALAFAGVALYTRIRPNAALENETRKQIFETVCRTPGLGVHAIAKEAAVSYSTTAYHLERLVEAGMIVMTPDGNKLCYYKNGGAFTETERRLLPVLKNDEAVRLLEAILASPGTYRAVLAERLGVTATTVNWHLKRLREAGLVEEVRSGRNAYLYARTSTLRDSLAALAAKMGAHDADVAERLRRYAATGAGAS